jgi:hypothetical protein
VSAFRNLCFLVLCVTFVATSGVVSQAREHWSCEWLVSENFSCPIGEQQASQGAAEAGCIQGAVQGAGGTTEQSCANVCEDHCGFYGSTGFGVWGAEDSVLQQPGESGGVCEGILYADGCYLAQFFCGCTPLGDLER